MKISVAYGGFRYVRGRYWILTKSHKCDIMTLLGYCSPKCLLIHHVEEANFV